MARASSMNFVKSANLPSRLFWRAFSDSARLWRRALFAFSYSRLPTSVFARSRSVVDFVASAPSSWAARMRSSASRTSFVIADVRSSVIVSRPSLVKSSADWKLLPSMAVRARESKSSTGATSRPRFFADRMRAWTLEKELDRCSDRDFSLFFHALFARSIAVGRSSPPRASRAFAKASSASEASAPTDFARAARFALDPRIAETRSR